MHAYQFYFFFENPVFVDREKAMDIINKQNIYIKKEIKLKFPLIVKSGI